MGFLAFIVLNALIIAAIYGGVRKPISILEFLREFVRKPFTFLAQFIFIGSCLIAGWGILSGGYLSWPINTPWGAIQSWQLAGIASISFVAGFFAYSIYENDFKRRN